jgi:hypothetical protein
MQKRGSAWLLGMALVMAGCSAMPTAAPRAALPTQAQWAGQDTAKLVRQLVQATFDRADKNHDRFLDASEWDKAMVVAADLNKDGRVTTLEWAERYAIEPLVQTWQAAAQTYFARLDTDKDGWVSRTEARGLSAVPGFGVPKDLYFDRYAGMNASLSPRVFTDFLLQIAYDNGRFTPFVVPPAFPSPDKPPAVQPSATPSAQPIPDPGFSPVVQAPTGPHPLPVPPTKVAESRQR